MTSPTGPGSTPLGSTWPSTAWTPAAPAAASKLSALLLGDGNGNDNGDRNHDHPPTRAQLNARKRIAWFKAREEFAAKVRAEAPPEPETVRVEILDGGGMFHPSLPRILQRGDVLDLPRAEADRLVATGHATPWRLVVATRDGVMIPSGYRPEGPGTPKGERNPQRVAKLGESVWTSPAMAEAIEERGDVVTVYPASTASKGRRS